MPTPRTRMTRETMLDNRQQAVARAVAALHPQVIASVVGGGHPGGPVTGTGLGADVARGEAQRQAAQAAAQHTAVPSGMGAHAAMAALAARRAETKPAQLAAMSPQEQGAYHQRFQQRKALGLPSLAGVRGGDLENLRRTGLLGAGRPSTTGQQQPARGPGDATGQTPYTPAAPVAAQQQESMANLLEQRQGSPVAPSPGGAGLLALVARLLAARGR